MAFGLMFRDQLDPVVAAELDQLIASIRQYLANQHLDDGAHGEVTAQSLTIVGGPGGIPADVDIDGDSTVAGDQSVGGFSTATNKFLVAAEGINELTIDGDTTLLTAAQVAAGVSSSVEQYDPFMTCVITNVNGTPRIQAIVSRTETPFVAQINRWLLINQTGTNVTLQHESGVENPEDDIHCPNNADYTLTPNAAVWLAWSPATEGLDAGWYIEGSPSSSLGGWVTPSFSAGDFTGNGSMSWTLTAPDVVTYQYKMLDATTMLLTVHVSNTSVGGTPNSELRVAIPNGETAQCSVFVNAYIDDNGTSSNGHAYVVSGQAYVGVRRTDFTSAFNASTNNTDIAFEIIIKVA